MGNFYVPVRWNVPLCFPSAEVYGRWREITRGNNMSPGADGYCADCTPEYQAQMRAQGRCEFPDTVFVADVDGVGFHGKRSRKAKRTIGIAYQRHPKKGFHHAHPA